jgi:hypothetical protein
VNKTFAGILLVVFLVAEAPSALAMGGMGGMGGGMGPGWGIDYGQPAPGYETQRSAKPTHKTKSVNHDHKQVVVH